MNDLIQEIQNLKERVEKLENGAYKLPTLPTLSKKFDVLVQEACKALSISIPEFYNGGRTRNVSIARHLVCYIGTMHMGLATSDIGKRIGKDHSTIIHGRNNFSNLLETNMYKEKDYYEIVLNALLK